MKKITFLFLVIVLLTAMSSTTMAEKPVLRAAAEATFVPFEFVDEKTNKVTGFDVDLVVALGEVMGYKIEFLNLAWDGLIPSLLNGNIDIIASGMSITEERALQLNFSEPYFTSVLTIMVRDNNTTITSLDDLKDKTVAVQISTTGDFEAEEIPGVKINRYNTAPDALQNVILGVADASILDLPVAEAFLASNPNAPLKHLGPVSADDYFGLALRKQDTELLEKVNAALAQIKADGTYDEIVEKWFGAK